MTRAKTKPSRNAPAFVVRSLTLARDTDETLQRLSQDATDFIGRAVSGSAIVRALVRLADQHGAAWETSLLFPLIEQELKSGVAWGKQK